MIEVDSKKLIETGIKYIYQLDCFPQSSVENQIRKELDGILSLNHPEVLDERLKYIGIGEKSDYLNQWLETDEGHVLAGIRHFGGNREKPFVLIWPSFRIKNIDAVIRNIDKYFQVFHPTHYHFWIRPDCNNFNASIIQQRFIGQIQVMEKCNLNLQKPVEFYDWYQSEYEKFHRLNPGYIERIPVNDQETMMHCMDEDLLFFLMEGDSRVGLIAGETDIFLDKPAVYLDEILIAQDFRGKGYAKKLLGSFIELLDAEYLVCDIDIDNLPSTKTALRSGQIIFSQECSIAVKE